MVAPDNIGRDFASVTGDYSPHHVSPFFAKLLGFKGEIVHGLWSLESCVSLLHQNNAIPNPPYRIEAQFKLPIYIPSELKLKFEKEASKTNFILYSKDLAYKHVVGQIINKK